MKLPLLTSLLALTLAVPAFSQETATPSLLGKRYIEVATALTDSSPDDGYTVGSAFNLPVAAHFDVGVTFQHSWLEGDTSNNYQDLAVYLTGYQDFGKLRAFARAQLGYEWWSVANEAFYQIDTGAEYAINARLLVGAQVSWYDYFSSNAAKGAWASGPKATYWVKSDIALSGAVSFLEGGDTTYILSVAFVF